MHILHTTFSFNSGGIENLLVDIMNNWNNAEDEIGLCVVNQDYNEALLEKIDKKRKVKLLNRPRKTKSIRFIIDYIKYLYKNKINIVHCHSGEAVKLAILGKICKPNLKIYYTVHDTRIYEHNPKWMVGLHNLFLRRIIAISKAVQDDIIKVNKKKNFVKVVYNGIDTKKFLKQKQKKEEKFVIGCVARIAPEKKGQDILLQAMKEVVQTYPNVTCIFAGEPMKGKEYLLEEVKGLAKELELLDYVKFIGNCNDVPSFLSSLDLKIVPSRYEGFGIVILEAMAAKVPVIASRLEGPEEIIKENQYGCLFEVEDAHALACLIKDIIEKRIVIDVEMVYKYLLEEYDIRVINEHLRDLYQN